MGKKMDDTFPEGAFDTLRNNVTTMHVCAGEPADRAAAISQSLANVALAAGDWTSANGDTSGRKVTRAQKSGVSVTATGTADHIAYIDATLLRYVTTATAQPLTSGNTVTIAASDIEIADPV